MLISFQVGGEIQYNCADISDFSDIRWMHANFNFPSGNITS